MSETIVTKIAVDLLLRDKVSQGDNPMVRFLEGLKDNLAAAHTSAEGVGAMLQRAVSPARRLADNASRFAEAMQRAKDAAESIRFPAMPAGGWPAGGSPAAPFPPSGPAAEPGTALVPVPSRASSQPEPPGAQFRGGGGSALPGGGAPANAPIPLDTSWLPPDRPPAPAPGVTPHDAMGIIYTAQAAGDMAAGAVKWTLNPAFQVGNERAKLEARLTPDQSAGMIDAARQQQTALPMTSVVGNIDVLRTLLSLTQNPDEARQLLPAMLPLGVALQHFSPEGGAYNEQLEAVVKSAEFRGAISKIDPATGKAEADPAAAIRIGRMLLGMDVLSKGAVSPAKGLQFLRSSGAAGAQMDESELPMLLPLIQAMGAAQAGTGLKAFNQQFAAGKMAGNAIDFLIDMGVIHGGGNYKTNKYVQKTGMGTYKIATGGMDAGAEDMFMNHPIEAIRDLLAPRAEEVERKAYGAQWDKFDPAKRRALTGNELVRLASRIPGGVLMQEAIRNSVLIDRDVGAADALKNKNMIAPLLNAPSAQLEAFTNTLNHLAATVGSKPMDVALGKLQGLTGVLGALSAAADNHPTATAAVAGAGAYVGGVWGAGALLGTIGYGAKRAGLAGLGWGASSFGGLLRRFSLPIAGGSVINDLDIDHDTGASRSGAWIDQHIPGAQAADQFTYRVTGGRLALFGGLGKDGQPIPTKPTGTQDVKIVNAGDLAHAISTGLTGALASTPSSSPGSHPISQPQMPGRH